MQQVGEQAAFVEGEQFVADFALGVVCFGMDCEGVVLPFEAALSEQIHDVFVSATGVLRGYQHVNIGALSFAQVVDVVDFAFEVVVVAVEAIEEYIGGACNDP